MRSWFPRLANSARHGAPMLLITSRYLETLHSAPPDFVFTRTHSTYASVVPMSGNFGQTWGTLVLVTSRESVTGLREIWEWLFTGQFSTLQQPSSRLPMDRSPHRRHRLDCVPLCNV